MSTLPALGRILRRPARSAPTRPLGAVRPHPPTGSDASIDERFEPAFRVARDAVERGDVPAAVVGIRHGTPAERAVEVMSRARGDKASRDSIWFLASVTKPVTAVALMLLVEDGSVDLDRPIVDDLPEFAGADRSAITPRHLLSHTAGIDDAATGSLTRSRPSSAQLLALAYRSPLRFPPGTRFEYSSVSFFLIAELIARKSGMTYPAFVRDRVLTPAGMDETAFDPRPLGRKRLMPVHGAALDSWWKKRIALSYLAGLAHPGGGLWGTADDVLRLGDAFLDSWHGRAGALLSTESIRELTRLQTAEAPRVRDGVERPANYALGWWKPGYGDEVPASRDAFEHGGASGTRLFVDPAHDLVVVYLSNEWQQPAELACWPLLREVYRALG
jgi:CubicO group peptidase (beta-lactamase class C family)